MRERERERERERKEKNNKEEVAVRELMGCGQKIFMLV